MPLPKSIDERVRKRFDDLISEAESITQQMDADNRDFHSRPKYLGGRSVAFLGSVHYQDANYESLVTRVTSLVQVVLGGTERGRQITADIHSMKSGTTSTKRIIGILKGLKDDYENGMLDDLYQMIESDIAADYMGQAEQLLSESQPGKHDHVPAAVLVGAILEDALRRLCQRQVPPIDVMKSNNEPKTMGTLIDDLKKANLYNELKAKQLRAWADIRNSAAHGRFDEFNRNDVEQMLVGVQQFLADFL